jgi:hypothetical protein
MTTAPTPTLISREAAYTQGLTRFYTGKPCKQGHIAQRYVSGGACVDCMGKFAPRRHPFRKDLAAYVCPKLWVPVNTTPEQFAALETYLATCIDAFFKHQQESTR